MSNLPPGVTGNEFEIAGPDFETECDLYCKKCRKVTCHVVQGYQGQRWAICQGCDTQIDEPDLDEPEPDWEAIAEARADARTEREMEYGLDA